MCWPPSAAPAEPPCPAGPPRSPPAGKTPAETRCPPGSLWAALPHGVFPHQQTPQVTPCLPSARLRGSIPDTRRHHSAPDNPSPPPWLEELRPLVASLHPAPPGSSVACRARSPAQPGTGTPGPSPAPAALGERWHRAELSMALPASEPGQRSRAGWWHCPTARPGTGLAAGLPAVPRAQSAPKQSEAAPARTTPAGRRGAGPAASPHRDSPHLRVQGSPFLL